MSHRALTCLATLPLLLLSGCATILVGTTQKVSITSEPSGAQAIVLPEQITLVTPGAAELKRHQIHTVRFTHDGCQPTMGYLGYAPGPATVGNLLFGGIIGMLIDESNGSAYTLAPDPLHATLAPLPQPSPAAAASVPEASATH